MVNQGFDELTDDGDGFEEMTDGGDGCDVVTDGCDEVADGGYGCRYVLKYQEYPSVGLSLRNFYIEKSLSLR